MKWGRIAVGVLALVVALAGASALIGSSGDGSTVSALELGEDEGFRRDDTPADLIEMDGDDDGDGDTNGGPRSRQPGAGKVKATNAGSAGAATNGGNTGGNTGGAGNTGGNTGGGGGGGGGGDRSRGGGGSGGGSRSRG